MRQEQTMALICFSGVNEADGETHVQICLGTEGGALADAAPYFFTITIAGSSVPDPSDSTTKGGGADAQRHRLPLSHRDMRNLRRWLDQVVPPEEE